MIYVIAKDGSGDFDTIQSAIDALPEEDSCPSTLVIRSGEYNERVVLNKRGVRLVGEDQQRTVITFSACAKDADSEGKPKGAFLSFTLLVAANDVEIENITVRNDAGDGRVAGQAVAVYSAGDRVAFRDCRLIAHQDTLFCGPLMPKVLKEIAPRTAFVECVESVGDSPLTHSRQYFENCYIQGDIDFIFGPYRCWFQGCELFMNERGGFYTAANTPEAQPYGFVFSRCKLTGACESGMAYLGRPWRKFARTHFSCCEMDECVSPEGFSDWGEDKPVTERLSEFSTMGARRDMTQRNPCEGLPSTCEVSDITPENVIGGLDGWKPHLPKPTWYVCGDSIAATYTKDKAPMTGWGQVLGLLTDNNAYVQNCAMCGRSSKSFVAEGRLSVIEICLRKGDKLLISFSHNDEKPDRGRHTEPGTTFEDYLSMYIDAANRRGAEPVLITPMPRRHVDQNGAHKHTHGDYPAAMKALAAYRGVRLIDLEAVIEKEIAIVGIEASKEMYCHVPKGHPNYPDGLEDNSHLSRTGAMKAAQLICTSVSKQK